jgi:hypothetical protein
VVCPLAAPKASSAPLRYPWLDGVAVPLVLAQSAAVKSHKLEQKASLEETRSRVSIPASATLAGNGYYGLAPVGHLYCGRVW